MESQTLQSIGSYLVTLLTTWAGSQTISSLLETFCFFRLLLRIPDTFFFLHLPSLRLTSPTGFDIRQRQLCASDLLARTISQAVCSNRFGQPRMCIQVVERYAACGCIYTVHGIDACALYGRHPVTEQTIYVGYKCPSHSGRAAAIPSSEMRRTQSARKAFGTSHMPRSTVAPSASRATSAPE
jgi:hypothetical protein